MEIRSLAHPTKRVRVRLGSLRDSNAELLVNSVDTKLTGCPDGVMGSLVAENAACDLAMDRSVTAGQVVFHELPRADPRAALHAVGQSWDERINDRDGRMVLQDNYRLALELAVDRGFASVAFPLLGTGGHGYPVAEAAETAVGAVLEFLRTSRIDPKYVEFMIPDTENKSIFEDLVEARGVDTETREHPVFGVLEFESGIWTGIVMADESPATVELYGEHIKDRDCAPCVDLVRSKTAAELFEPVAGEYLDLLNAHWRERPDPYSLSKFLEMLRLVHIGIEEGGEFMLSLEVANLFGGHQITLEYDENGELLDSHFG